MGPRRRVGTVGDGRTMRGLYVCGGCERVFDDAGFPGGGDLCRDCCEELEDARTLRALWVLLALALAGVAIFAWMAW